jgi:hypothetical protein
LPALDQAFDVQLDGLMHAPFRFLALAPAGAGPVVTPAPEAA